MPTHILNPISYTAVHVARAETLSIDPRITLTIISKKTLVSRGYYERGALNSLAKLQFCSYM